MKNRIVGILVIGIAALIAFIIFTFNRALTKITSESCTEGPTCPMWQTIDAQTTISTGILILVVLIGFYLIFFGKEEKIVTKVLKVREQIQPKAITRENYEKVLHSLPEEEQRVLGMVIDAKGSIMQSEIVSTLGINKVKVTRILDKFEGTGYIERKRRGMSNIIILKPNFS